MANKKIPKGLTAEMARNVMNQLKAEDPELYNRRPNIEEIAFGDQPDWLKQNCAKFQERCQIAVDNSVLGYISPETQAAAIESARESLLHSVEIPSCKEDPQAWQSNMDYKSYKDLCHQLHDEPAYTHHSDDIYALKVKTTDGRYITRPGYPLEVNEELGHFFECENCHLVGGFYICKFKPGEQVQCPECNHWHPDNS